MCFTNRDETLEYLRKHTESEWEEATPVYLHFKTYHNPHRQFCVFASPDWLRKGPLAKFYIPTGKTDLHSPVSFVSNFKKGVELATPWYQINLDLFPPKTFVKPLPNDTAIVCKVKYSGTIKTKPLTSSNNLSLSITNFNFLSLEAKNQVASILGNEISPVVDMDKKEISIGLEVANKEWTTKLSMHFPEMTAELSPEPFTFVYNGWRFICNISLEISCTIVQKPPEKEHSDFWHEFEEVGLTSTAALGISVFIIFTDGAGSFIFAAV